MYDILTEQLKHYTVLWRETSALYEEWAKKRGLSYYELLVILSIMEPDGPCLQKDICTHWQLPKQTVNTILKNFAGRAWITLVPSEEDRRGKVILLTRAGYLWKPRLPIFRPMKGPSGKRWARRMPEHC